ncbi:MAG: hypothetical protein IAG13_09615 [Deltaproteobacteria bacterium]|nr:hypothetical protein [Nannocystaceae bacterium]
MPIERLGQTSLSSGRAVVIDRRAAEWDARGVLVEELPRGTFAIQGERAGVGTPWRDVWIELAAGEPVAHEFAGTVSVEVEPLMLIDESAVAAWSAADRDGVTAEAIELSTKSATGSGELELADGRVCVFATSWGDGVFPVFVDRDRSGQPVRVRVRLQNDATDDE